MRRRRARGGVRRLLDLAVTPPWRRAPRLLLRRGNRAVLAAVLVAGLVLGAAAAATPLFLVSTANASFADQSAAECNVASGTLLTTGVALHPRPDEPDGPSAAELQAEFDKLDREARRDLATLPHSGPLRRTFVREGLVVAAPATPESSEPVSLIAREGFLDHVEQVESSGRAGVWVPAGVAERRGITAGGEVLLGGARVPVAGTYRSFLRAPPDRFWCGLEALLLPPGVLRDPPPAPLLTDFDTLLAVDAEQPGSIAVTWERALGDGLTLEEARAVAAARRELTGRLRPEPGPLFFMVSRAEALSEGVRGGVGPVSVAGLVVALLLVAAAGGYWVERRHAEVRLLVARGAGSAALAVKAALEMALPLLAGTLAGWAVAVGLVGLVGPADRLGGEAPPAALLDSARAVLLGAALLGAVAALRTRALVERATGTRAAPLLRWVPWELGVLALAALALDRIVERGVPVARGAEVPTVDLLLLAFPLLFLVGSVGVVARLAGFALPRLGRGGAGWPHGLYLAARRLASSSRLVLVLLAATAMSIGVLCYAAALTASIQTTLAAKAGVFLGSEASVLTLDRRDPPASIPATRALSTSGLAPDGGVVDVLVVDRASFERGAFWHGSFAGRPLDELLAGLAPAGRAVPALAVGRLPAEGAVRLLREAGGTLDLTYEVRGRPRVFPGLGSNPLLVVARDALPAELAGESRLWVEGSPREVEDALQAAGIPWIRMVTAERVLQVGLFKVTGWTFAFMQSFGILIGAITVAGLLLYVETRQRRRQLSYAMARRMGLRRRSHWASLLTEIGGTLVAGFAAGVAMSGVAMALVYGQLDAMPEVRPGPLLKLPVVAWAATGVAVVVVTVMSAGVAQRAADRAKVAEVVRLAE